MSNIRRPGQVKTRLAAALGPTAAAELYGAFLADLTSRFRDAGDRRFLCYSPDTPEAAAWFKDLAGTDYELWPQPPGSLEPRLQKFFSFAQEEDADRTVVIGSDSPTLPREFVELAFERLSTTDCLLGPATDGGYYLLGLKKPLPIFHAIDWSTPNVLPQTVAHLRECRASLELLPPWYDVDTAEDLDWLRAHVQALTYAKDSVIETLAQTRSLLGQ